MPEGEAMASSTKADDSSEEEEMTFFSTIFNFEHSVVPEATVQALKFLPLAVVAVVADWCHWDILPQDAASTDVMIPISTLVGLMVALRVSDAYNAWVRANRLMSDLAACAMQVMSQSLALKTREERVEKRNKEVFNRMRRYLVCALFTTVQLAKKTDKEVDKLRDVYGLLTPEEHRIVTIDVHTISRIDGKKDRFPSRNRPSIFFFWIHEIIVELDLKDTSSMLHRTSKPSPAPLLHRTSKPNPLPPHLCLTSVIVSLVSAALVQRMATLVVDIEQTAHLHVPAPYAQVHAADAARLPPPTYCHTFSYLLIPSHTLSHPRTHLLTHLLTPSRR